MRSPRAIPGLAVVLVGALAASGQSGCETPGPAFTFSNVFFARHVTFTTDANNNVTSAQSIWGMLTFDTSDTSCSYAFTGQQVVNGGAPAAFSASGTYGVDWNSGNAILTFTNPQQSSLTIASALGRILVGASTGAPAATYDLFVAVAAPPIGIPSAYGGNFTATLFSIAPGAPATVRSAGFALQVNATRNFSGTFTIPDFQATGRVTGVNGGALLKQTFHGATGTITQITPGGSAGLGTLAFTAPTGDSPATPLLDLEYEVGYGPYYDTGVPDGVRGSVLLGGSTTGHDILIGFEQFDNTSKPASIAVMQGPFVTGGISFTPAAGFATYSGVARVLSGGRMLLSRSINAASQGALDVTQAVVFTMPANGMGTIGAMPLVLCNSLDSWFDAALDSGDTNNFALDIGTVVLPVQAAADFDWGNLLPPGEPVSTFGILSAASHAPVTPDLPALAPGELLAIRGTGLAAETVVARPPLPTTLAGVKVHVGPFLAPLYFVSPTLIYCVVPYEVTVGKGPFSYSYGGTGETIWGMRITSTAPGFFSLDQSGTGAGFILHADYTLVSTARPAAKGETLTAFATGLGAVRTNPPDAAGATAPEPVLAAVQIRVSGVPANVQSATLVPGEPGLYQVVFTIPPADALAASGALPLTIATADVVSEQTDVAVK